MLDRNMGRPEDRLCKKISAGSNSVRLMLRAEGKETQYLETTRLGQGVAERMLQPVPVERTVAAIKRFYAMAKEADCEKVLMFATSAVRDAMNREILLQPVKEACGIEIDVVPGEVEAQLAYHGAAQGKRAVFAAQMERDAGSRIP